MTWPNEPPREDPPDGAWARPNDGTAPDPPPPPAEPNQPPATSEPPAPQPHQGYPGPEYPAPPASAEPDDAAAGRRHAAGQPPPAPGEASPTGQYPGTAQGPVYQPYPGQQPYPPPYPGAPYGPQPTTNGLAIAALVCSLAGVITVISAPVGAVLGHLALREVGRTGQEGRSLAIAAIWVGWIITGLVLLACCGAIAVWRTTVPMR